jgi:ABC-type branched-subunit amino acid transport system substrate-binding protein
VILPLSGDFAQYGERTRSRLELNKPPQVKFVYEDEGCAPRSAVTAFKKLTEVDRARIIVGPWCGSPQVAIAPILARIGGVAILPNSAPERVFDLSQQRMLSLQASIESESRFNAEQAYRLGARRVVILFFENDFSRAHEAAFRATFRGEVLETIAYTDAGGETLRSAALKIKQLGADTVYIPDAFPLMHGITRQLATLRLTQLRKISVYSAESPEVARAVGADGEGLLLSYPRTPADVEVYFSELTGRVLGAAIQVCAGAEPECVREKLMQQNRFNEHGVLEGELGLRVLRNGRFEWL